MGNGKWELGGPAVVRSGTLKMHRAVATLFTPLSPAACGSGRCVIRFACALLCCREVGIGASDVIARALTSLTSRPISPLSLAACGLSRRAIRQACVNTGGRPFSFALNKGAVLLYYPHFSERKHSQARLGSASTNRFPIAPRARTIRGRYLILPPIL